MSSLRMRGYAPFLTKKAEELLYLFRGWDFNQKEGGSPTGPLPPDRLVRDKRAGGENRMGCDTSLATLEVRVH